MKRNFVLLGIIAIIAFSCEKDEFRKGPPDGVPKGGNVNLGAPAPGDASIAAIAIDAGFDELVGALVYVDEELDAGLVDLFLDGTDQYTVFAPTNDAFEALYEALEIDGITDLEPELVLDVLLYHVAEGRRAANSVVPPRGTRTITTLLGATFSVNSSGVITDIAGQEVGIVTPNISASNGIIHVIDAVLLPLGEENNTKRARAANAAPAAQAAPAPGDASIAEIVVASTEAEEPQFTLLLAALEYTGLTGVFTGGEQYTVFAPTDEAFINLVTAVAGLLDPDVLDEDGPFAAIDDLLGEGTVANVLLYHVAEGRRAAISVVPPVRPRTITTLLGATFSVDRNAKIIAVGNTANIVAADISASNGIIHVINAVILPIDLGL